LYPQQAGDSRGGGHHLKNQYPADHLFTLLAQHLGQPGQIAGFMMQVFAGDVGAGAVPTHHQSPGDQQIDGFADSHARDAELFRQLFFPGKRAADFEIGGVEAQT